jgi:hypothetical protein
MIHLYGDDESGVSQANFIPDTLCVYHAVTDV